MGLRRVSKISMDMVQITRPKGTIDTDQDYQYDIVSSHAMKFWGKGNGRKGIENRASSSFRSSYLTDKMQCNGLTGTLNMTLLHILIA